MNVNVRHNNAWVEPQSTHVRHNNAWEEPRETWVRIAGVWRQLVPSNAVIFYNRNDGWDGELADLSDGRFIMGTPTAANIGVSTGASTHTNHGASVAVNTLYNTHIAAGTWGASNGASSATQHRHTVAAHSHTSTGSNAPTDSSRRYMKATHKNHVLREGAVFFHQDSLSSLIYAVLNITSYLWAVTASNVATQAAGALHNHGAATMNTSDYATAYDHYQAQNSTWAATHRHTANHTQPNRSVIPSFRSVRGYEVGANQTLYFDQLPAGTILPFLSATLPYGWVRYSGLDGRLLKIQNAATFVGGFSTHTHSSATQTTGGVVTVTARHLSSGTHASRKRVGGHTHTWADNHADARNHMPLSIQLWFGIKS